MDSKASFSFLFILVLFHVFCSSSLAFNITKILSKYPDFETFNKLLSDTGLAKQINSRQTITVLAIPNGPAAELSGKPLDVVKKTLGPHVILDYYDEEKLNKLQNKSSILTTLYQTTGDANDRQGFVTVTKTSKGIMFGSAAKGAPLSASLVGVVSKQPYNISILEVSAVIQTPGIETLPKAGAPKKAPAPAPTQADEDDAPTEAPAEAPEAEGPVSDAPESDAPISSPPSNTPISSPPQSESEPPQSDGEIPAEAPAENSGSSRTLVGGAVVAIMACIMAL